MFSLLVFISRPKIVMSKHSFNLHHDDTMTSDDDEEEEEDNDDDDDDDENKEVREIIRGGTKMSKREF